MGIENKIFHGPSNPFEDYASFLEDRRRETRKAILKVLLSLGPPAPNEEPGYGFACVLHDRLFHNVRSRLGYCVQGADPRYLTLLIDFMTTIENLTRGPQMNPAWLKFIGERQDDVQALLQEFNAFKAELRNRVRELGALITFSHGQNIRQWLWRDPNDLKDVLVHDIKISQDLPVAIDTVISPHGWEIQIFLRSGGNYEKLRALLKSLQVEFEEDDRLIYRPRFLYGEPFQTIQPHLQGLVEKLAGASPQPVATSSPPNPSMQPTGFAGG
ncbi:hypothetical protein BH24PSE2_BH24PSE2_13840 [soil metagenome]